MDELESIMVFECHNPKPIPLRMKRFNGSNHDKVYQNYVTRHPFSTLLDTPILLIFS